MTGERQDAGDVGAPETPPVPPASPPRARRSLPRRRPPLVPSDRRPGWRSLALLALLGTAVIAASALLADDEPAPQVAAEAPPPPQVRPLVRDMGPVRKAEAVLIAGVGAGAPPAGQQLGGVLVGPVAGAGSAQTIRSGAPGPIPPLIVARQEGGAYRSLPSLPPAELQFEIGDTASPEAAEDWARRTAAALREAGFDMNLAPLADVATLASPIADRVFGDDAELVSRLTGAAVRGCREAGILCAVPHFPGLGAASEDTEAGPATVGLDGPSLAARDLAPFRAAFAAGAPAVVLSHAFYAALDPITPGSLSAPIAGELLREGVGFEGVAITDDLTAGAITAGHAVPEAAVAALAAGADMVLVSDPGAAQETREALIAAVRRGAIPPRRINEAVGRVLDMKRRAGLIGGPG